MVGGATAMAGGTKTSGLTDPDRIWSEASVRLRAEIGDGPFSSYIAPSAVRLDNAGHLILVTPTAYARDWVRKNALRRMNELWLGLDGLSRRLDVRCRAEMGSTPSASQVAAGRAEGAAVIPLQPVSIPMATVPPVADGARAVRAAGLQDRLTFDSFVEGQGNAFALAIARQAAGWADGHFNPIFFCGPYGYGKTHLLNAIAWEAQRLRPDAKVVYLTAEYFMWRFATAIRDNDALTLKDSLRNIDLLIIDDMQFLQGKMIQHEFCHLLNMLLDSAKQVVVAADRAPWELESLDPRVRSRLQGGVAIEMEAPDYDMRLDMMKSRLDVVRKDDPSIDIPADILEHVARNITSSGRDLEGAFNQLLFRRSFEPNLSIERVDELLAHLVGAGDQKRVRIEDIQRVVARHYNVSRQELVSNRRTRVIVKPRQIAMYLSKTLTPRSFPEIGRRFGGRDHTTVLHAVRKIEELISADQKLSQEIELLRRLINE